MYPAVRKQVQEITHRSDLYDRLKNYDVKVRRDNVIMSAVNLTNKPTKRVGTLSLSSRWR